MTEITGRIRVQFLNAPDCRHRDVTRKRAALTTSRPWFCCGLFVAALLSGFFERGALLFVQLAVLCAGRTAVCSGRKAVEGGNRGGGKTQTGRNSLSPELRIGSSRDEGRQPDEGRSDRNQEAR